MQTVAHEQVGSRRTPQRGEGVDNWPVTLADDLGDSPQVFVAEPNPELGQTTVRCHLLFVDRRRSDPYASRRGLSGNALTQLGNVARGLLVMDERLRGVRALRTCVIRAEEEEYPVGP